VDFNTTLIGQSIAMIVFVWFCTKYIWPFITNAIEARQVEIADGLAAAERGRSDLAQAKGDASKLVAQAREQAREIVEQANTRAGGIVDEGRAAGEAERLRQIESAKTEIEVQINRARDELRTEVATLAIAAAEKVLGREIDAKAHRDLLDRLANDL